MVQLGRLYHLKKACFNGHSTASLFLVFVSLFSIELKYTFATSLRFLQREMCRKLEHNAGLNPVQFRVPKSKQGPLRYERRLGKIDDLYL
jgi:hypothetical protein